MKPTQAKLEKRLEDLEAQARRAGLGQVAVTDEELLAIIEQARNQNRAWIRERFPKLDDPNFADVEEFDAIREIEARPVTAWEIETLRAMMKRSAAAGIA